MAVLILLSAFLISSNAHAQSSVTLFGMLDVGVSYVSNEGGGHALEASDSIYTPSLIGLRGSEDLGGGYKAVFEVMSQFSPDTGAGIPGPGADFSREAYVGLGRNDLGTLTFGQQYNLMADFLFFPPGQFDASFLYGGFYNMRQGPFAALGIPDNPTGASDLDQMGQTSRVSNSVKFTSATFDGLRFAAPPVRSRRTTQSALRRTTRVAISGLALHTTRPAMRRLTMATTVSGTSERAFTRPLAISI